MARFGMIAELDRLADGAVGALQGRTTQCGGKQAKGKQAAKAGRKMNQLDAAVV